MEKNSKDLYNLVVDTIKQQAKAGVGNNTYISAKSIFLLIESDLKRLISDGFSFISIYNALKANNKMPCTYRTFCKYAGPLKEKIRQDISTTQTKPNINVIQKNNMIPNRTTTISSNVPSNFNFDPDYLKNEEL